jgi:WD40 repeat protein
MCWYDMSNFGSGRPTKVAPFRQHAIAAVAQPWSNTVSTTPGDVSADQTDDRVLLVRHERSLELFRLHSSTSEPHTTATRGKHTTVHHFAGSFGLRCAALSPDARWVACGHAGGLSVVSLDSSLGCVNQWRVSVDAVDGVPIEMSFTRDMPSSRLIVATQSGKVLVYELPISVEKDEEEEEEEEDRSTKVLGAPLDTFQVDGTVQVVVTDPSATWVAAGARNGDVYVHKFSQSATTASRKNKGAVKKRSTTGGYRVPNALFGGKPCTSLAFHPEEAGVLVVLSADNRFYFYDVKDQKVSDWSVQHTARIPDQLVHASARAIDMTFDPAQPRKIILWSSAFIFVVDLDVIASRTPKAVEVEDETKDGTASADGHKSKKARLKSGVGAKKKSNKSTCKSSGANGVRVCKDYGPIVFLDYTKAGQALVLEANWLKVMSHFPNVLHRQRYGTN